MPQYESQTQLEQQRRQLQFKYFLFIAQKSTLTHTHTAQKHAQSEDTVETEIESGRREQLLQQSNSRLNLRSLSFIVAIMRLLNAQGRIQCD